MASVPAARAEDGCAVVVVAAKGLAPAWGGAVVELRAQISRLAGAECQPMVLSLESLDGSARLVAITPDGRRAERTVSRPEALAAMAFGLLTTIPHDSAPSALPRALPASSAQARDGTQPAERGREPRDREAPTSAPAPAPSEPPKMTASSVRGMVPPRSMELWTGLSAGLRLTAPTDVTVLDVEARADFLLGHWLLLATIRSAVVSCLGQQGLDCDVYNDVGLGVGVGRRFRAAEAAVDVGFEPSVVAMHMEYDSAGTEGASVDGTLVTLRTDVSARLMLPLGERWALTVTIDGGLAPTLLASPTRLPLPVGALGGQPAPFPAWTGGLRFGASGALL